MSILSELKSVYKKSDTLQTMFCALMRIFGFNKIVKRGRQNSIHASTAILRKTSITFKGKSNVIELGSLARFTNTKIVVIGNNHHLIVEDDCNIHNSIFWFEDDSCTIKIGKGTTMEGVHIAVTEPNSNISLGNDCMLSAEIDIRNGDSHSIIDAASGKRINYAKNITVGDHVWIGLGSTILKGSFIGANSIIGTKSVVTGNIPDSCIAVGTPAKVVRENVSWTRKRIYQ